MSGFTLDTSGAVETRSPPNNIHHTFWPDLSPFEQGYVEALFASLRFFHMECPSCEWDCVVGPPGIADQSLTCSLCAGDNGRDVYLRTIGGERDMPAKVEGSDARSSLRFDRLAPSTINAIRKDCAAFLEFAREVCAVKGYENNPSDGAWFWKARQIDREWTDAGFPPLTITLGDDGLVYLGAA